MTPELYTLWLPLANFVLTWGTALFIWVSNRSKATSAHVAALELRLTKAEQDATAAAVRSNAVASLIDEVNKRVHALENELGTKPTQSDISQLYDSIRALAETVHKLVGETEQQSAYLRLLITDKVRG